MASLMRIIPRRLAAYPIARSYSGEHGSGIGKGGGGGGDIRSAGGSFGKMEAAHEEQYFRKLQAEQLSQLKRSHYEQSIYHDKEIDHHEKSIARHREAIERHRLMKTQHEAHIRQTEDIEKQQIVNDN